MLRRRDCDVRNLWRTVEGDPQVDESAGAVRSRTGGTVGVAMPMVVPMLLRAMLFRAR